MRSAFRADDVRAAERATGSLLTDGTLMQRAATALAVVVVDLLPRVYGARVVLLVGSGDNGGDALYAGARLAGRGARVHAVAASGTTHAAASAALRAAGGRLIAADDLGVAAVLAEADVVVDGIVGIGGRGGLREPAGSLLDLVPDDALVVAADLPSGVDADTGVVDGAAVAADVTLCFGALKPGVLIDPGAARAGVVLSVDLGLAEHLPAEPALASLDADDVAALLPRPDAASDKYARGVLGVAAGSAAYTGAAVLTVAGALGTGVGMVRFCAPTAVADLVRAAHPEAVVTEPTESGPLGSTGRVQAWVVGPGGGTDDAAADVLRAVLDEPLPVVVDAAGLELLAGRGDLAALLTGRTAATVLTPHAGELARLLGVERAAVEAERLDHATRAAERFRATVLLKGSTTLVAAPGRGARVNPVATAWLATAGSGDVLAGVVGALLASGLAARDAASVGAWLHAAAGALASADGPIRAGEVAEALPVVVAERLGGGGGGESTA